MSAHKAFKKSLILHKSQIAKISDFAFLAAQFQKWQASPMPVWLVLVLKSKKFTWSEIYIHGLEKIEEFRFEFSKIHLLIAYSCLWLKGLLKQSSKRPILGLGKRNDCNLKKKNYLI